MDNNIGAFGWLIAVGGILYGIGSTKSEYCKVDRINQLNPTNICLQNVNNDSLQDLVYKTGEIFLQTKNGNFVSYDSIMNQEKTRIDSIYKARQDSIKRIYEDNLEKRVK